VAESALQVASAGRGDRISSQMGQLTLTFHDGYGGTNL
jgi:hypothetical protein